MTPAIASRSIFPVHTMDREVLRWETLLDEPTPWEFQQGIWFKREDFFAPLGYAGPNGSKMRQLIWYVNRYRAGRTHIVTGASVQSPQLSMSAIVGSHYGLPCTQVVYSRPNTVLGHDNPRTAAGFGAVFDYAKGPYNPILQARVAALTQPETLVVEYGITVPHPRYPAEDVRAFHAVGARQVANMPPQVRKLIVPAGSCNSLTSVLLGLSEAPSNLEELRTIGIGPDKRDWVASRLAYMGVDAAALPFRWTHHSLHDTGFSTYSEKFRNERFRGIAFHPTYEAKVWRWLRQHEVPAQDGSVGFWIVGSEAKLDVVRPFFTHAEKEAAR